MLSDHAPSISSGRLDKEIHLPSTAKHELLDFIAEELPRWRDHPERPHRESETGLTEHLVDHLNSATYYSNDWSHVQFHPETCDELKPGRKIDLTVKPKAAVIFIGSRRHNQFEALFPIECKRLPTPKEKDRDEREYVITDPGTTGGIQRFKFGHHGATHSFAAMIAFVQENSFSHWESAVNGWISRLAKRPGLPWHLSDKLQTLRKDDDSKLCVLQSCHQRTGNLGEIELRHLWIEMN